jgi:hypothetical protein
MSKKQSLWIAHVFDTASKLGVSYACAIPEASKSYKKINSLPEEDKIFELQRLEALASKMEAKPKKPLSEKQIANRAKKAEAKKAEKEAKKAEKEAKKKEREMAKLRKSYNEPIPAYSQKKIDDAMF